jgi:predicted DCC family thiol-disulfide oxidoreductase YuxK
MTSSDRPVVLFDGRCGFCAWSVQFAQQRVDADVEFLPYQSVDVAAYGLTDQQCAEAVYFVDTSGARPGELAVAAILQSGRGVWKPLGRLIASPAVRPLAAGVYRVVARHRGRLWGVRPPIS